ncbi:transposase family protein [Streptomyces sp. NPDC047869]|uniref:transposase family protein n=1 Tax=Streptomyces sp. NPDC047869 TaxID=3154709 RepID=UPI003453B62D
MNRLISSLRTTVERGFASLKTFRILTKVRIHPRHATALVRALLVLTHHQVARGGLGAACPGRGHDRSGRDRRLSRYERPLKDSATYGPLA